jgi:hypothetical protein
LCDVFAGEAGSISQGNLGWPYTQEIKFKRLFIEVPTVTYGLIFLDVGAKRNTRIRVSAENVTNKGLRFVIDRWADTTLYGADITWMACGPSA